MVRYSSFSLSLSPPCLPINRFDIDLQMTHLEHRLNLATVPSASSPSCRYYGMVLSWWCSCSTSHVISSVAPLENDHTAPCHTSWAGRPKENLDLGSQSCVSHIGLSASIHIHLLTGWFSIIYCILDVVPLKHYQCCVQFHIFWKAIISVFLPSK